jgi:pimeloyl-ACP methyl ester carboxylesterase
MRERPKTRYARVGEHVSVGYQVVGDGPIDLVYLQGFVSHLDLHWEWEPLARFLSDLAAISRLIVIDPRGSGISERFAPPDVPPIETLMEDVLAVMSDAESERAVVFATEECGFVAMPFAATYPDRCSGLVLWSAAPTWWRDDVIHWGWDQAMWDRAAVEVLATWGEEEPTRDWLQETSPSVADLPGAAEFLARLQRSCSTPTGIVAMTRRWAHTDVRGVLPSIHVPTLVMHAEADALESVESARYLAAHIPGARLEILPGSDHMPVGVNRGRIVDAISRFLSSIRPTEASLDRVLATVLFTDIVGSAARAAKLGDRGWRDTVEQHHGTVRALLRRYRGNEIDTAGDGFFASFDGPARAVGCAVEIAESVRPLGIEIRAGVHTGEVETIDGKVGGMAVVIGSRVAALAAPSEVLVSQTVKDLVAGSGLVFEDRGEHELKGVPDSWRLYRVAT